MKKNYFLSLRIYILFLFFTQFLSAQTFLNESFTGATLPTDWQIVSAGNTGGYTWTFYDAYDDVEVYEKNGAIQHEMLISPSMDLSQINNAYINFSMWLYGVNSFITNNTTDVRVMVNVNNGGFVEIWNENDLTASAFTGNYFYNRNIPKSLAAFCGPGKTNVKIGFLFTSTGTGSNYGGQAYLMDVKVSTDCPIPALKTFTGNQITWFPIDNFSGTYDLKITENGVDTIIPNLSGSSYDFTSPKCNYSVAIRANCGGTVGEWSDAGNSFNASVSNINNTFSANTNTVSWTGNSVSYDLEYGPKGFAHGNGILVNGITSTSYAITGIFPCQDYQYYIRTNCGNGNVGNWSLVQNFNLPVTSALSPISPTFTENFDASLCQIGYLSSVGNNNISGSTAGGTLTMFSDTTNRRAVVVTRGVNLTAGVPVYISSKIKKYNTNSVSGTLKVGNSNNYLTHTKSVLNLVTLSNISFSTVSSMYTPTFTGVHYFSFDFTSPSASTVSGLIIDDLTIDNCAVSFSSVSNIGSSSANLNVNMACTSYDIELLPNGTSLGMGIQFLNNTNSILNLSSLNSCTSYVIYARPNCGNTNGNWTFIGSFTTVNANPTHATIPYTTDFSGNACTNQWQNIGNFSAISNNQIQMCLNNGTPSQVVSRGIFLEAGKVYLMKFNYKNQTNGTANLSIRRGVNTDIASHVFIVQEYNALPLTASFTPAFFDVVVPENGIYYFSFNLSGTGASCSFFIDDFSLNYPLISMIGSNVGSAPWNSDVDMQTADGKVYVLNNFAIPTSGDLKFRQEHAWIPNYGPVETPGNFPIGTAVQNGNTIPVPAGVYDIYFNRSTGYYSFMTALSNEETQQSEMKIYPNPVSEYLELKTKDKILEVLIYDFSGKLVMKRKDLSLKKLSVSDLPSGSYILEVKTNKNLYRQQFIKK